MPSQGFARQDLFADAETMAIGGLSYREDYISPDEEAALIARVDEQPWSTELLRRRGYQSIGLDISPKLVALGRHKFPGLELIEGDAENLPFESASLDGVLLSGLVHHFPDPRRLAGEVKRVLRDGGRFVAFDPNRMNPFMWLYRDRASPFYSSVGVTENERPVLAWKIADVFRDEGFRVQTDYLAGLAYRYVASRRTRMLLPIYNFIDGAVFNLAIMQRFRPFVLTSGEKL